jgi:hypothetical protein
MWEQDGIVDGVAIDGRENRPAGFDPAASGE